MSYRPQQYWEDRHRREGPAAVSRAGFDGKQQAMQASRIQHCLLALLTRFVLDPGEHVYDPKRAILDFGCGSGRFTRFLSGYGLYLGVDISRAAIELARLETGYNDRFAVIRPPSFSIANLYGESECPRFQVIVAATVFQHMPSDDLRAAAQAIHEVANPLATWLIIDDNPLTAPPGKPPDHMHRRTPEVLAAEIFGARPYQMLHRGAALIDSPNSHYAMVLKNGVG